ncbi:MAG: hypothetical protein LBM00_01750 [Deltaproteobacteria bacterium]|jgi:hypothetical protein|nr:hypothetical protein [Deltaproteobacteria bacterium]
MPNHARTQFYPRHIDSHRENGRTAPNSPAESIKKVRLPGLALLALLALLNFAGCAGFDDTLQKIDNSLQFEITRPPVIVREELVRREPPVVHIYPVTEAAGLKVLFVPFRVTQPISNPELAGYGISKLFWQTWASMEIFEYMEFLPEAGPFRTDSAMRIARSRGADLMVSGYVTRLLSGGEAASSSVALQLEAYDVSSGSLVWSMAQAGAIAKPESRDYVLFTTRGKISSDPLYTITATLAEDMGQIMLKWSNGSEKSD